MFIFFGVYVFKDSPNVCFQWESWKTVMAFFWVLLKLPEVRSFSTRVSFPSLSKKKQGEFFSNKKT
jgi:hypothetical protein